MIAQPSAVAPTASAAARQAMRKRPVATSQTPSGHRNSLATMTSASGMAARACARQRQVSAIPSASSGVMAPSRMSCRTAIER